MGFQLVQKIMVAQAVDTKSLLRLSTSAFRHLRIIFSNIGLKVFRLELKMRLYESSGLTHLQQTDLAVDKLLLESTGSSMTREIKTVHVLTARALHGSISSVFAILKKQTTYFHEHPEHKVNILIGGDKGSFYTTFLFKILVKKCSKFRNFLKTQLRICNTKILLYLGNLRLRFFSMRISKCWTS